MNKVLKMTFDNQFDSKTSLSLPDPKSDLTEGTIKAAMNKIIEKGVFEDKNGRLVSPFSARIVETKEVVYDFA